MRKKINTGRNSVDAVINFYAKPKTYSDKNSLP